MARFVLASGSPRRRQLLREGGYEFEVVSPPVEEVAHQWLTVREVTTWNAARKAARVCEMAPDAVVLAADTLVAVDGEVLGKPADFEAAIEMLRRCAAGSPAGRGNPSFPSPALFFNPGVRRVARSCSGF